MPIDPQIDNSKVAVHIQIPTFRTKQMVVEQQARPLVILVQVLDPFPLLEHLRFNPIPLARVVNSEANYEGAETYPGRLLVKHRPHPIGNGSGVPHGPRRCIKSPICQGYKACLLMRH